MTYKFDSYILSSSCLTQEQGCVRSKSGSRAASQMSDSMNSAVGDLSLRGCPINWTFYVEAKPRDGPPITLTSVVDVIPLAMVPLHPEAKLKLQGVLNEMPIAFDMRAEIITKIVALNDNMRLHLQQADLRHLGFEVTDSRIIELTDTDKEGVSFEGLKCRLVPLQAPINGPNLQDEELMREIQGHDVIHVAVPELNNVEGGVVAALDVQAALVVPDNNNIVRLVPLPDEDQQVVPGAGHLVQLNAEGAGVVAAMDLQAGFLVLDNDPYLLVEVADLDSVLMQATDPSKLVLFEPIMEAQEFG